MTKEIKPIAMQCTQEQFEKIEPILIKNGFKISQLDSFDVYYYLVNNLDGNDRVVSNVIYNYPKYDRTVFEEWDEDTFLKYCGIETEKQTNKTMGYKLTVPVTDVLEIHTIACDAWKNTIKVNYLRRLDENQNITFTESEIDEMFLAATFDQKPVLSKIFGKKKKEIDYSKLKTGSKVMIKYTGQHCNGINNNVDLKKPFDIVFYKTKHYICYDGRFNSQGNYASNITFHQNGKYALFASHENTDYIIYVIEY
mgnify:CR=1 FL=1